MEELGPIAVGTLSSSRKKYRTKDGKEHVCGDSAVLKFAGTLIDFFERFFLWCRCGFRAKTHPNHILGKLMF